MDENVKLISDLITMFENKDIGSVSSYVEPHKLIFKYKNQIKNNQEFVNNITIFTY